MALANCQKAGKIWGGLGAAVGAGAMPEAEEFLHFQPQKVAKKAYLRKELMANFICLSDR